MSWTDVFPILTDEMVEQYHASADPDEKRECRNFFNVEKWINKQKTDHIVSTSLFWKNASTKSRKLPTPTLANLINARQKGLVERFEPWKHYVQPILEAAPKLDEGIKFRVYLSNDLEFLVPHLVAAGCEIALMAHSSLAHNPGAMWRYLAFEEHKKLVTFIDADRALEAEFDVRRTEETHRAGLGAWRVPVWGEMNIIGKMAYRPIIGGQLGSCKRIPAQPLMEALVWHVKNGTIDTCCNAPGLGRQPIHGTVWPNYGFDEWFLLSCIYPRIAQNGILTFAPVNSSSRLLPLDIEYTMWSCAKSEMVYFGELEPEPNLHNRKKTARKSNQRVLLTGIWQVKTDNDVNLITELLDYAKKQDVEVDIKPVLHIRSDDAYKRLPEFLKKNCIKWEGLNYNVSVQRTLLHAVCHGHEADWIWQADSDERVDFLSVGGLSAAIAKADRCGADYVPGEWIDRIAPNNILPRIDTEVGLAQQFPHPVLAVKFFGKSRQAKIALHRRDCLTGIGNHDPEESWKIPTAWSIPIWHFKWHSDCKDNQKNKLAVDPHWDWSWEMEQCVGNLIEIDDSITADWNSLPKKAWVKVKKIWKIGAYPVGESSYAV